LIESRHSMSARAASDEQRRTMARMSFMDFDVGVLVGYCGLVASTTRKPRSVNRYSGSNQ
jgi:hypothetical protein